MTGLVRTATLLTVGGLLAAGVAAAGVPSAATSSLNGNFIRLGPQRGGQVVNPAGVGAITKTIVVRDAANNPIQNSTVILNWSLCSGAGATQEFKLSQTQPHHPGVFTNCAAREISTQTDAAGIATFRISGGAQRAAGNPPGYAGLPVPANACVTVTADGVALGRLVGSAPDQDFNNGNGMSGGDLGLVAGDRLSVIINGNAVGYRARSDFDGDGDVDGTDVGIAGAVRLDSIVNGASISALPACP